MLVSPHKPSCSTETVTGLDITAFGQHVTHVGSPVGEANVACVFQLWGCRALSHIERISRRQ